MLYGKMHRQKRPRRVDTMPGHCMKFLLLILSIGMEKMKKSESENDTD